MEEPMLQDPIGDQVRDAPAAEVTPAPAAPTAPVPATTLSTDAVAARKQLEEWLPDHSSPYWRGNDLHSAEWLQEHYRGLIRAEGQSTDAVGPEHTIDRDLPVSPERYDLSGVGRSMTADQAGVIAEFTPVAHSLGLGQERTARLVGYVLQTPEISPASFKYWAVSQGYSDKTIDALLAWHGKEVAKRAT